MKVRDPCFKGHLNKDSLKCKIGRFKSWFISLALSIIIFKAPLPLILKPDILLSNFFQKKL